MASNYKIKNPNGLYFITFATVQWVDVFTRSIYFEILVDSFRFCMKEKGLEIYSFVIMSNHIHLVAKSTKEPLQNIIRDFKKFTSVKIISEIQNNPQESRKNWMLWIFGSAGKKNPNNINYQLWQQEYHGIELFSNDVIDTKINYIHQNPVRIGIVENDFDYIYSSARNYAGKSGVLDVIVEY